MHFRVRLQLAEAFGPLNRWYCSQAYGRCIEDRELLLTYYIKSGGADDFRRRYEQAMDAMNRWFCSQFHDRDVRDPQTLWEYYMNYAPTEAGNDRPSAESNASAELCIAC